MVCAQGESMVEQEIICGVCGAENKSSAERCGSCGAKIIQLSGELSEMELYERRNQQDHFSWKWAFISFGLLTGLAAVAFVLLPAVISGFDPQGFAGVCILNVLWFVGGAAINYASTDKTFFEPAMGGLLAAFPAVAMIARLADIYPLSTPSYMIAGLMAVMMALMGAFVGNRLKVGKIEAPKPKRSRRPPSAHPRKA
ncbi:MAG: hypothetical protein R3A47_09670 [Polyangiales bacterium]